MEGCSGAKSGIAASMDLVCVLMRFCHVRSLGLYIRGVEEESRSRKEGLFQEDECIIKINNTDLMDKTFSQSVQHSCVASYLSPLCVSSPVAFTHPISCLVFHRSEAAAENKAGCCPLIHHWHQFERPFQCFSRCQVKQGSLKYINIRVFGDLM